MSSCSFNYYIKKSKKSKFLPPCQSIFNGTALRLGLYAIPNLVTLLVGEKRLGKSAVFVTPVYIRCFKIIKGDVID